MRKLGILVIAMLLVVSMSVGVMALTNPWVDDGDTVDVNLNVPPMGEVYSSIGTGQARNDDPAINLKVTNAGGVIPQEGIAEDTLNHYSNVSYNVFVEIDGDIPNYSRFHVIVNPQNDYSSITSNIAAGHNPVQADKVITWDRRVGGQYGQGGYGANAPGDTIKAFSGSPSINSHQTNVDYAMDAIMGIPPENSDKNIDVIWTIAAQ